MNSKSEEFSEAETARREDAALKRLLATPPQPKLKKAGDANPPKKRGWPPKAKD